MRRAALAAVLLFMGVRAGAEPGRTAAVFLRRAMGARAAAMGGASAALLDPGPDAPQYNPAGLARLRRPAFASSYLNGFGGVNHGHLAYAHPLPFGTLAAGLLYFNAGKIELNLANGQRGSVTSEEDSAYTLSYGVPLGFGLSAGGTFRHVRLELAETASATSQQGDAGLLWKTPVPGLSLGAAGQYYGGDIVFEEAGDPPPKTLRLGAALRLPALDVTKLDPAADLDAFDMTLAADVVKTVFEDAPPRAGLELGMTPAFMTRIALRFGWVFKSFSEGMTFGAGFKAGKLRFDYGYGSAREMRGLQNISLGYEF
ncbi:MAG: PorV/PorQ family protein [Elusimicrobia bacterium]|nr:PorV/PorQ family protein [Elusimicrobiota bacterium]